MNILFVTPYIPSRLRARPYGFIRQLAQHGHAVHLACLVQPAWEFGYLAEVTPYCRAVDAVFPGRLEPYLRVLASLHTRLPLSVACCRSRKFDRLVKDLARGERFDLIHTEFVRSAPATMYIDAFPKVYDAVDSLTLAYRRSLSAEGIPLRRRLVALLELAKMRGFEIWVLSHYHRWLVSSPVDRCSLEQNRRRFTVIPNGVDLDYFTDHDSPRSGQTILFLGKMSYYANVASVMWFYRRVLPLVRCTRPQVRFEIVGCSPARTIRLLTVDPAVQVTGAVPDVRPHLARATLAVCPMVCGAGIQNKLLEAMASGTPCVATSLAAQALQARAGDDLLVADGAEAFAAAVLELLDNPERRRSLAQNARSYVQAYHSWERIGGQLNRVYTGIQEGNG